MLIPRLDLSFLSFALYCSTLFSIDSVALGVSLFVRLLYAILGGVLCWCRYLYVFVLICLCGAFLGALVLLFSGFFFFFDYDVYLV